MLLKFYINFLTWFYVENGQWSTAAFDLSEYGGILRIIKAEERSIVNRESISPEMKDALDGLLSWRLTCSRVLYDLTWRIITT